MTDFNPTSTSFSNNVQVKEAHFSYGINDVNHREEIFGTNPLLLYLGIEEQPYQQRKKFSDLLRSDIDFSIIGTQFCKKSDIALAPVSLYHWYVERMRQVGLLEGKVIDARHIGEFDYRNLEGLSHTLVRYFPGPYARKMSSELSVKLFGDNEQAQLLHSTTNFTRWADEKSLPVVTPYHIVKNSCSKMEIEHLSLFDESNCAGVMIRGAQGEGGSAAKAVSSNEELLDFIRSSRGFNDDYVIQPFVSGIISSPCGTAKLDPVTNEITLLTLSEQTLRNGAHGGNKGLELPEPLMKKVIKVFRRCCQSFLEEISEPTVMGFDFLITYTEEVYVSEVNVRPCGSTITTLALEVRGFYGAQWESLKLPFSTYDEIPKVLKEYVYDGTNHTSMIDIINPANNTFLVASRDNEEFDYIKSLLL